MSKSIEIENIEETIRRASKGKRKRELSTATEAGDGGSKKTQRAKSDIGASGKKSSSSKTKSSRKSSIDKEKSSRHRSSSSRHAKASSKHSTKKYKKSRHSRRRSSSSSNSSSGASTSSSSESSSEQSSDSAASSRSSSVHRSGRSGRSRSPSPIKAKSATKPPTTNEPTIDTNDEITSANKSTGKPIEASPRYCPNSPDYTPTQQVTEQHSIENLIEPNATLNTNIIEEKAVEEKVVKVVEEKVVEEKVVEEIEIVEKNVNNDCEIPSVYKNIMNENVKKNSGKIATTITRPPTQDALVGKLNNVLINFKGPTLKPTVKSIENIPSKSIINNNNKNNIEPEKIVQQPREHLRRIEHQPKSNAAAAAAAATAKVVARAISTSRDNISVAGGSGSSSGASSVSIQSNLKNKNLEDAEADIDDDDEDDEDDCDDVDGGKSKNGELNKTRNKNIAKKQKYCKPKEIKIRYAQTFKDLFPKYRIICCCPMEKCEFRFTHECSRFIGLNEVKFNYELRDRHYKCEHCNISVYHKECFTYHPPTIVECVSRLVTIRCTQCRYGWSYTTPECYHNSLDTCNKGCIKISHQCKRPE